jgi:hypothetical protein
MTVVVPRGRDEVVDLLQGKDLTLLDSHDPKVGPGDQPELADPSVATATAGHPHRVAGRRVVRWSRPRGGGAAAGRART